MILLTVPSTVVLGRSETRRVSRLISLILADLAIRGFPISFRTLARVALPDSFLPFLFGIHLSSEQNQAHAVQFCTVARDTPILVREVLFGSLGSIRTILVVKRYENARPRVDQNT
jgi:hypothetical protein